MEVSNVNYTEQKVEEEHWPDLDHFRLFPIEDDYWPVLKLLKRTFRSYFMMNLKKSVFLLKNSPINYQKLYNLKTNFKRGRKEDLKRSIRTEVILEVIWKIVESSV